MQVMKKYYNWHINLAFVKENDMKKIIILNGAGKKNGNTDLQFPLFLYNDKQLFQLEFDCQACEMRVHSLWVFNNHCCLFPAIHVYGYRPGETDMSDELFFFHQLSLLE